MPSKSKRLDTMAYFCTLLQANNTLKESIFETVLYSRSLSISMHFSRYYALLECGNHIDYCTRKIFKTLLYDYKEDFLVARFSSSKIMGNHYLSIIYKIENNLTSKKRFIVELIFPISLFLVLCIGAFAVNSYILVPRYIEYLKLDWGAPTLLVLYIIIFFSSYYILVGYFFRILIYFILLNIVCKYTGINLTYILSRLRIRTNIYHMSCRIKLYQGLIEGINTGAPFQVLLHDILKNGKLLTNKKIEGIVKKISSGQPVLYCLQDISFLNEKSIKDIIVAYKGKNTKSELERILKFEKDILDVTKIRNRSLITFIIFFMCMVLICWTVYLAVYGDTIDQIYDKYNQMKKVTDLNRKN